jgi:NADP-dependent aldehyde dehydrogenase
MGAPDTVDAAARAAAASGFADSSRADRALWLRALATALEADAPSLVALAHRETHLSEARLSGEVVRTAAQLRFFADVCAEGSYLEATIDTPDPSTIPPRPDLRRMLRPIGVVAVFTASNFPFAFSVLGNDTASALAAGCPVVVKAHPGHPELSRRVAELGRTALAAAGAPADALVLVGAGEDGVEAGVELIRHPLVRAVGFTGSTRGGRALFDIAVSRPDPIPFYGELGSVNPVVVTPRAAREDAAGLAAGLAASFTRDGGQYCTKPGIVFVPAGTGFEDALAEAAGGVAGQQLLTGGMTEAFARGAAALATRPDVDAIVAPRDGGTGASEPAVLATSATAFAADPAGFQEEHFGPLTLIVRYEDEAPGGDLDTALGVLEGSLTGTVRHGASDDVALLDRVTRALAHVSGRVLYDGWPTGVAIAWAQHHGGPWPASTASVHTSVGATAVRRFLAPVAYQDAPQPVLPAELRDGNPLGIPRREDGVLVG